ncbi:hypothetical protein MJT46_009700 [Ovis ammon polii x Ovis aries]|nr:hypothetical protein MJT46_009700 [Ovis ammon polii x Ovis aries]
MHQCVVGLSKYNSRKITLSKILMKTETIQRKLCPGWKAIIVLTPENRLHCSGPRGSPRCRLWLSEVDLRNPGLGENEQDLDHVCALDSVGTEDENLGNPHVQREATVTERCCAKYSMRVDGWSCGPRTVSRAARSVLSEKLLLKLTAVWGEQLWSLSEGFLGGRGWHCQGHRVLASNPFLFGSAGGDGITLLLFPFAFGERKIGHPPPPTTVLLESSGNEDEYVSSSFVLSDRAAVREVAQTVCTCFLPAQDALLSAALLVVMVPALPELLKVFPTSCSVLVRSRQ